MAAFDAWRPRKLLKRMRKEKEGKQRVEAANERTIRAEIIKAWGTWCANVRFRLQAEGIISHVTERKSFHAYMATHTHPSPTSLIAYIAYGKTKHDTSINSGNHRCLFDLHHDKSKRTIINFKIHNIQWAIEKESRG